ncbi:NUDIX hydrolase [Paenibacillus sp. HW567]|uniref:NUDIX hydrolase n=1 Tax=Paenibacillus sp. HW567 TaxID=1034769 RepID=UPI000363AD9F|nr:NUDIX domain-containing protein [Paenibacillus sp. HW567]
MKVIMHEAGANEEALKYVVIVMKQGEQWVMARHKERSTWEFAGGHIDKGESADEAAARELYEETGALEYELYPICIYSVVREDMPESFGKLYLATVNRFGPMPQYEMEEIRAFTELPEAVTYPLFYPAFLERVNAFIN